MGFSKVSEDVTQNILSRLPAQSFSYAACVNKSWNKVCSRVLLRPKLASALSLNPSIPESIKGVVDKVLAEPIRPDFAIASVGRQFCLELTHQLLTQRLGSRIPIVTTIAKGIIGPDAVTDKMKEVDWEVVDVAEENNFQHHDCVPDRGIVLMVGYLPGLKVGLVPLLRPKMLKELQAVRTFTNCVPFFDKFLRDIKNYTLSVSGIEGPACIILFGNEKIDMKPVMSKMDLELPEETIIVGDASSSFFSSSTDHSQRNLGETYFVDSVALVFAKDRNKPNGIGETQFNVALSTGLLPFGPQLQALGIMIKGSNFSWLTAKIEGQEFALDGQRLMEDILEEFQQSEDVDDFHELYIGVLKQRERSNGSKRLRPGMSLNYYELLGADNIFFVITGVGIKPGDSFLFFHSDTDTAASSYASVYKSFQLLKGQAKCKKQHESGASSSADGQRKEVFGALIFSCCIRGERFSYAYPFQENFPGVPIGGVFCKKQIGRVANGCILNQDEDDEDEDYPSCSLHYYSTVYLVLSYTSP